MSQTLHLMSLSFMSVLGKDQLQHILQKGMHKSLLEKMAEQESESRVI